MYLHSNTSTPKALQQQPSRITSHLQLSQIYVSNLLTVVNFAYEPHQEHQPEKTEKKKPPRKFKMFSFLVFFFLSKRSRLLTDFLFVWNLLLLFLLYCRISIIFSFLYGKNHTHTHLARTDAKLKKKWRPSESLTDTNYDNLATLVLHLKH